MSNTVLAERQLHDSGDAESFDYEHVLPRRTRRPASISRSKRRSKNAWLKWLTVPLLVACSFVSCVVGGCYVGAFASITLQAREISELNSRIAKAEAQHEFLVRQVAALQSDHHIAPTVSALKMSFASTDPYIDETTSDSGPRVVASAQ